MTNSLTGQNQVHGSSLTTGFQRASNPTFLRPNLFETVRSLRRSRQGSAASIKYDVSIAFAQNKQFVESDQMEIVDYGERVFCIKRGRPIAYTALFHCARDEKTIRWAETSEIDGQFVTKISKPASLLPGQDAQRQLLTKLSKVFLVNRGASFQHLANHSRVTE